MNKKNIRKMYLDEGDNRAMFNAMAETNKPILKPNYRETRKEKRKRLKGLGLI